jgi:hypothetical protein
MSRSPAPPAYSHLPLETNMSRRLGRAIFAVPLFGQPDWLGFVRDKGAQRLLTLIFYTMQAEVVHFQEVATLKTA